MIRILIKTLQKLSFSSRPLNRTYFKLHAIFALIILLSACANKATHVVISPDLQLTNESLFTNKQANISVLDLRPGAHIMQILKKDQAAELYSAQQPLNKIVTQALIPALTQQGLLVDSQAENKIEIIINKALINVQQELMKYQANNNITLTVSIDNNRQTLTKTFKTTGNSNGPLRADLAVLERDFNQQLSKLLKQIITDAEIINFIR